MFLFLWEARKKAAASASFRSRNRGGVPRTNPVDEIVRTGANACGLASSYTHVPFRCSRVSQCNGLRRHSPSTCPSQAILAGKRTLGRSTYWPTLSPARGKVLFGVPTVCGLSGSPAPRCGSDVSSFLQRKTGCASNCMAKHPRAFTRRVLRNVVPPRISGKRFLSNGLHRGAARSRNWHPDRQELARACSPQRNPVDQFSSALAVIFEKISRLSKISPLTDYI